MTSRQGPSRRTRFLLTEYYRFFKYKVFLQLAVLNYDILHVNDNLESFTKQRAETNLLRASLSSLSSLRAHI